MSDPRPPLGPNYRKLLASATAANLGDGLMAVALIWLASAITRDAMLIALVKRSRNTNRRRPECGTCVTGCRDGSPPGPQPSAQQSEDLEQRTNGTSFRGGQSRRRPRRAAWT